MEFFLPKWYVLILTLFFLLFSVHEPVNHEPVKEGSGGGCSYNDDEDCYSDDDTYYENYYYEGSGSGDGSDEDSSETNEGSKNKPDPRKNNKNKNRENEADDDEENWPPWVTAKPVEENKINDIEMVDEANNPVIKPKPRKPSFNRSSPNLSGSVLSVTCATLLALYFAVKSHWWEREKKSWNHLCFSMSPSQILVF